MRLNSRGFTLMELMVVIAMIVILSATGMYTYYDSLPGMRVKAAARELFGTLHRARITAMTTSTPVTVSLNPPNSYTVGTETIPISAENPGVQFGTAAPAYTMTPVNGIAVPLDGTLPQDQFSIDRRGRPSKDGEIYLIPAKDLVAGRTDRTYCIVVRQIGTYRLLRYNGTTWQ
jgi:prepilin-type N-terminal cleavage/methylation domain-containing protein